MNLQFIFCWVRLQFDSVIIDIPLYSMEYI